MAQTSVVLIGYGAGGRVFHAPLIGATPGLELAAVVTSDDQRSARALADWPTAVIHRDVTDALGRGYDVAVISTVNATHVPLALQALEAGLHVVLDKPIAPDTAKAEELAAAAQRAGRLLVPYQNRRWDSDFLTAVTVAHCGALGSLHRFESRIERFRQQPKDGWKGSPDPAAMGGLLYDLGPHVIDQALQLMGPVAWVFAAVRAVRPDERTNDDVVVLLEHVSGALSVLTLSQAGAFAQPRMALFGTRGGLRIDAADTQEARLLAGDDPRAIDWGVEPDGSAATLRTWDETGHEATRAVPLERGAWPRFYAGVAEAVRGGAPVPVTLASVIDGVRVLDAVRESGTTGQRVRLDPPAGRHPG